MTVLLADSQLVVALVWEILFLTLLLQRLPLVKCPYYCILQNSTLISFHFNIQLYEL